MAAGRVRGAGSGMMRWEMVWAQDEDVDGEMGNDAGAGWGMGVGAPEGRVRKEDVGGRGRSGQQLIGVGNEIEEGVEIRFIFSLIEEIEKGAFFGAGFVLLFLLDKQLGGEALSAETG